MIFSEMCVCMAVLQTAGRAEEGERETDMMETDNSSVPFPPLLITVFSHHDSCKRSFGLKHWTAAFGSQNSMSDKGEKR